MKYTILCIDDNENNLFTYKALLSQLENVEIILADSGSRGLEIILSQEIDIILLDVQMPEMDGFEVASYVKKNDTTSHIPIILISAIFTSDEFLERGYKSGAIDYLAKPIDDNHLLNKITLYLNLLQKEKQLILERNRLQQILDIQNNIVMVITKKAIIQVNQSFLNLVGSRSLKAFLNDYKCICEIFVTKEGYLGGCKEKSWIDIVLKNNQTNHIVLMPFKDKQHYFAVNVHILDTQREEFVVTFTNITQRELQSIELERESSLDPLTQIYNRRKLEQESKKLFYIAQKYRMEVALLILDIDHFKKVNDTYGHLVGDNVLIELAKQIAQQLGEGDIFARFGGEEFVIIMPESSTEDAMRKAQALVQYIAEFSFKEIGHLSMSIGVASRLENEDLASLLRRADEALYAAKTNGRNRVELKE